MRTYTVTRKPARPPGGRMSAQHAAPKLTHDAGLNDLLMASFVLLCAQACASCHEQHKPVRSLRGHVLLMSRYAHACATSPE